MIPSIMIYPRIKAEQEGTAVLGALTKEVMKMD